MAKHTTTAKAAKKKKRVGSVGTGGAKKAMSAIQKRNARMRKLAGLD